MAAPSNPAKREKSSCQLGAVGSAAIPAQRQVRQLPNLIYAVTHDAVFGRSEKPKRHTRRASQPNRELQAFGTAESNLCEPQNAPRRGHPAGFLGGLCLALLGIGMVLLALLPANPSVANSVWRMAISQ
jgi:uncharacterized membrane protein YfcA